MLMLLLNKRLRSNGYLFNCIYESYFGRNLGWAFIKLRIKLFKVFHVHLNPLLLLLRYFLIFNWEKCSFEITCTINESC